MARPQRGSIAAGFYHVTRRSAGPVDMFHDEYDRRFFLELLVATMKRYGWICHSFCLMTTHYHLLLEVAENMLQPGMHMLNARYAQAFNRRWGRSGHLKGSPYGAKWIADEHHFLGAVRYIALNPVKAGLCKHPAEWLWSSYRGCAGYDAGFPFVTNDLVLDSMHEDRARAQQLLRIFVESV